MALTAMRGTMEAWWNVAAPASLTAPSAAAVLAYTDILHGTGSDGECLADMDGWGRNVGTVAIPDACSLTTKTIPGENTLGVGSLTYYLDDTTTPIKDLFTIGLVGHVILAPIGVVSTLRSVIAKVTVLTNQVNYAVANEGATFTVTFSKTSQTNGIFAA